MVSLNELIVYISKISTFQVLQSANIEASEVDNLVEIFSAQFQLLQNTINIIAFTLV